MRPSEFLAVWFAMHWSRKALLTGAAVAACVPLTVMHLFGYASLLVILLIGAAVILSVMAPDSEAGVIVTCSVVFGWVLWMRPQVASGPLSLVAALSLLLYHCALTLAAHRPPSSAVNRADLRRWGGRTAVVAGACVAAWLLMVTFVGAPLGAPTWGRSVALLAVSVFLVFGGRALGAERRAD